MIRICKECLYDIPPGEEPEEYEVVSIEECEYQKEWEDVTDGTTRT
jgi:hypothetical protein